MLEEELAKTVQAIDPTLSYVCSYPGFLYVCRVERNGQPYIFKMFDSKAMPDCRDQLSVGREHFDNERRALELLVNTHGIPQLNKIYTTNRFHVLLREFIDGGECTQLGGAKAVVASRLTALYSEMMHHGVALMDTRHEDIIVASRNDPYIVDFGHSMFFSDLKTAKLRASVRTSACSMLHKFLENLS